jgi:hypothetical protein
MTNPEKGALSYPKTKIMGDSEEGTTRDNWKKKPKTFHIAGE